MDFTVEVGTATFRNWSGRTIVSLTPAALSSDSRTLKQAATFARLGAKSIVIEGQPSGQDFSRLGIDVSCVAPVIAATVPGPVQTPQAEAVMPESQRPWIKDAAVHGLNIVDLWKSSWLPAFRKMPPADAVVLHSFYFLPAALMMKLRHRTPYIYDAHDFYPEMNKTSAASPFDRQWTIPMHNKLDSRAVRHSQGFMTVSEGVADLYVQRSKRRPMIVRNLHDRRLDKRPVRETIRERCGLGNDAKLIVMVGNAKAGAALDEVIQALASIRPETHLALVGRGYEPYSGVADKYGVRERVHICGAVPADEVVPFIETANYSIIPYFAITDNFDQALPNRLFQSIAAGLPLLYPRLRQIQKLVAEYDIGVECDTTDPQSIVDGYRRVCSCDSHAMTTRLHRAADDLSWEREEQRLVKLVETLFR